MVVLLGKCYQETHDILREKAKKNETKIYFEIPIVQGTKLTCAVEDISKLNCNGNVPTSKALNQYMERLKTNHK